MPRPSAVPQASLIGACVRRKTYADSCAFVAPGVKTLAECVEAFYTMRLFKLERWH